MVYGVIQGLKADIEAGHLSTLRELIHADLFSDLLETSEYFLEEGHKDPAAVMIGGVLEGHLRQLCHKNGIATEEMTGRGMKPKKADAMNSDLSRDNVVYSKLEQKSVTAWLDLRNKAAHGEYDTYDKQQVVLFLQGVRDFISKFPA